MDYLLCQKATSTSYNNMSCLLNWLGVFLAPLQGLDLTESGLGGQPQGMQHVS